MSNIRKEIDGIRALAIIPVILFHAGFSFAKGGYIGVDIFFVISGFLITTLILNELSTETFSLKKFYERRIRRLLPALFFVIFISILVSIFFMPQLKQEEFSKSILSVIFFVSNIYFYSRSGYFAESTQETPLLHTWSLSIEEQFYLLFPIFLILIWPLGRKFIFLILLLIALFSLSLTQFGGNFSFTPPFVESKFHFSNPPIWAFFNTLTRAWELLAGSLLAVTIIKKNYYKKNNFISFFGLTLLLISFFLFDEQTAHPSILTLLPILGTILIILSAQEGTIVYKFLSSRLMVFVGLISYSAYLWHQPLFAFTSMNSIGQPNSIVKIILCILSFVLAYFSWKYIERPFRDTNSNKIFIISFKKLSIMLLSLIFIFIGYFIYAKTDILAYQRELPKDLKDSISLSDNYMQCMDSNFSTIGNQQCILGNANINQEFFMIGDSHARAMTYLFNAVSLNKNKSGFFSAYSGCTPFLGIYTFRPDKEKRRINQSCKQFNEEIFKFIKNKKIGTIFLVARWDYYSYGGYDNNNISYIGITQSDKKNQVYTRKAFEHGLKETVRRYSEINTKVVVINQIPMQKYDIKKLYYILYDQGIENKLINQYSVSLDEFNILNKFAKDSFKGNNSKNFKVIDFTEVYCNDINCPFGSNTYSFYHDDDHLSDKGSLRASGVLDKFFDTIK